MVLGALISTPNFNGLGAVYLPMALAAVGIIMSIIGTFFVYNSTPVPRNPPKIRENHKTRSRAPA